MTTRTLTRADHCIVAMAEVFRGDGEIFASPMGTIPAIGARLARASFEPDLVLTDGIATCVAGALPVGATATNPDALPDGCVVEGWMPFRTVFDNLWWGRRHVVMGGSQLDAFGNQNLTCIGPWEQPKAQLLGMRGAPGNTINHATSYWIPNHSVKVFVETVDVVSGVGNDRAAKLGAAGRFHDLRRVVTNLGVLDFGGPDGRMRLIGVHPGVSVDDVVTNTGFALTVADDVAETRDPTDAEWILIHEVLDPNGYAANELGL